MMSDKATLVNEDEYALEHESYGTHLIQVTPLNGFKNEGYVDTESTATQSQSNSEQKTLASVYHAINGEQEINDDNSSTDFIVAMFVVIFDTKRGNEVEWCIPTDADLTGVEFKAMVSGSHTITQDFIYFKHKTFYGLSCYERISVDNAEERGARMKSVGVICTKYTSLHEHMEFLEKQVRQHLELPCHYEELTKYYRDYRSCPNRNNTNFPSPRLERIDAIDELPVLKITHPAGCFSQFIKYFGEKIFALWKLILLQKRILFFSPPPAGIACYRVYCTCLLGNHAIPFVSDWNTNPLFSVNVCDIGNLSTTYRYVACTTEKIFETKPEVYDVYVDNQNIKCSEHLAPLVRTNTADKERFTCLYNFSNQQFMAGADVTDDEKIYTRFFIEQNNRIFKTFYEVSSREDRTLTAQAVHEMGLDTTGDRLFIAQLVDLYSINVVLPDVVCC